MTNTKMIYLNAATEVPSITKRVVHSQRARLLHTTMKE